MEASGKQEEGLRRDLLDAFDDCGEAKVHTGGYKAHVHDAIDTPGLVVIDSLHLFYLDTYYSPPCPKQPAPT